MEFRSPLLLTLIIAIGAFSNAGSLYTQDGYRALTGDSKAVRVGDLITVHVLENSSATTSTDTNTQRNNNLSAGFTSTASGSPKSGSLAVAGSFDGGGTTQRANKLLATLSVSVREVLTNGDLKVAGDQLLTVNGEQHKVHLEGRVRLQDISNDNVVLSTRLADAKITYIGNGDLSERQKRSWWRKFVDWMGF